MTETALFSFGVGISFTFLAGAYVYLRERTTTALEGAQLIPIRAHRTGPDQAAAPASVRHY